MKTKIKLSPMAKRYQMAHSFALATLPDWKRVAVISDIENNHNNRFVEDFCKEVIQLAESITFKEKGVPPIATSSTSTLPSVELPKNSSPRY